MKENEKIFHNKNQIEKLIIVRASNLEGGLLRRSGRQLFLEL